MKGRCFAISRDSSSECKIENSSKFELSRGNTLEDFTAIDVDCVHIRYGVKKRYTFFILPNYMMIV